MYIDDELILAAIKELVDFKFVGTRNRDLFAYYLLLKKLGFNKFTPYSVTKVFHGDNKDKNLPIVYELGGMFDAIENVSKKGILFFTSFYLAVQPDSGTGIFYNQATEFRALHGRLKDTIDNTVQDHLLVMNVKVGEKFYKFKPNVEDIIVAEYNKKCPLWALLVWIYRSRDFEQISFEILKNLFLDDYGLTRNELFQLFDLSSHLITIKPNPIRHLNIRQELQVTGKVEISSSGLPLFSYAPARVTQTVIRNLTGVNSTMTPDELCNLLKNHLQVILTGVPGTGKSFLCNEVVKKYDAYIKLQFHPEFTYQDFMLGKTFVGDKIESVPGQIPMFLDKIKAQENPNKKFLIILDEINRGNLSSIFGEFIYALDREKEIDVKNQFILRLPQNIHIIGTMNSADRSIALVDYAIRRRFVFVELEPEYEIIDEKSSYNGENILGSFLKHINEKIETLLNNRDFRLGQSFFILSDGNSNGIVNWTDRMVYETLHYKIIPMLKEYAYGNDEMIQAILSPAVCDATVANLHQSIKVLLSPTQS